MKGTSSHRRLVLASSSPRRVQLLAMLGLPFVQDPSRAEEPLPAGPVGTLDPEDWALRQALRKAKDVARRHPGALVIGADTVVELDGRLLGKPRDRQEAMAILGALAGREHRVASGVAVVDASTGRAATGTRLTRVWMRPLTRTEIEAYVATGEPMDKAGAYAIQGLGATLVPRIEGCYFNVVGLPLPLLADLLSLFGVRVLGPERILAHPGPGASGR
ncbi:septum formation protein Maf [Thermaerobacter sp. PB12/4term]|uniref:Maf family protein n=1 Tax=Thermaerobacter sp. PB12/4term TaxID=2293838 RepID=UPI000E326F43|nr:Maf family protein [Thermaerobacter sp. PB12/4term]QIA27979.1 septum formation protein Maf [Thermaerobacter sp. PB12/4term]